jgi:hypothetical protein
MKRAIQALLSLYCLWGCGSNSPELPQPNSPPERNGDAQASSSSSSGSIAPVPDAARSETGSTSVQRYDCTKDCTKARTSDAYQTQCKQEQDDAIAKGCNAVHYALVTCVMAKGSCDFNTGKWGSLNVCESEFKAYQTCILK